MHAPLAYKARRLRRTIKYEAVLKTSIPISSNKPMLLSTRPSMFNALLVISSVRS